MKQPEEEKRGSETGRDTPAPQGGEGPREDERQTRTRPPPRTRDGRPPKAKKRTPREEAAYKKKMKEIYQKLGGASLLWVPTKEELE